MYFFGYLDITVPQCFFFSLQKDCDGSCFFCPLNPLGMMRNGSKTSSSCRKMLMLLSAAVFELCIFIVGVNPRFSETAKSDGRVYFANLYKTCTHTIVLYHTLEVPLIIPLCFQRTMLKHLFRFLLTLQYILRRKLECIFFYIAIGAFLFPVRSLDFTGLVYKTDNNNSSLTWNSLKNEAAEKQNLRPIS